MRLFFAVDPSEDVRAALCAAIARVHDRAPNARWMKSAGIHVTLKFLGDAGAARGDAIAEAVRGVVARHPPLTLRAAGVGTFGDGDRPKVLWIGIAGDTGALRALQRDIEDAVQPLGFAPETRTFTPHFTLALAREEAGDPGLAACVPLLDAGAADFGVSRVAEVILYRSRFAFFGERYAPLTRFVLGRS